MQQTGTGNDQFHVSDWLHSFMKRDSSSGIVLVMTAVLAMLMENSPLKWLYDALLNTPVEVRIGALHLAKPLLLWINDGLMAVFFMLVGLEVSARCLKASCPVRIRSCCRVWAPWAACWYRRASTSGSIGLGWARLPTGASLAGFYGVSILCGIGFTMSLFITSLAFEHTGPGGSISADRLGILLGSLISALAGYLVLRLWRPGNA